MTKPPTRDTSETIVLDDVIPSGHLPPLKYRDLPEPIAVRGMIGPSIILAGLALGSGEFVFWPYITYQSQFLFFWACLLGLTTQYFINMEITRWALATGESAITGFIRLNKHWAWVFLVLNIVPWMIPAWAKGAAQILSWLIWGPTFDGQGQLSSAYETPLAIGGMVVCGLILTTGPIVYETVEKIQIFLVALVMVLIIVLAAWLISGRPDAIVAQVTSTVTLGAPQFVPTLDPVFLLGALAFAGAGGTTNLGQANYIKDKGYGMGHWIGRITSPITGQEEAITEVGFHFPATEENSRRWRQWWRAASWEHFLSFFVTCLVCLVLLTLVSYILFFDEHGNPTAEAAKYGHDISFIWGEATALNGMLGRPAMTIFLLMGIAILLTTEFGVLDASSRISMDIVKVTWLRGNPRWTESRLYYVFLWGTILLGSAILWIGDERVKGSFLLFKMTAALNGGVMFLYSVLLLVLNRHRLPSGVRMPWWRMLVIAWAVLFFGFFCCWATKTALWPALAALWASTTGLLY